MTPPSAQKQAQGATWAEGSVISQPPRKQGAENWRADFDSAERPLTDSKTPYEVDYCPVGSDQFLHGSGPNEVGEFDDDRTPSRASRPDYREADVAATRFEFSRNQVQHLENDEESVSTGDMSQHPSSMWEAESVERGGDASLRLRPQDVYRGMIAGISGTAPRPQDTDTGDDETTPVMGPAIPNHAKRKVAPPMHYQSTYSGLGGPETELSTAAVSMNEDDVEAAGSGTSLGTRFKQMLYRITSKVQGTPSNDETSHDKHPMEMPLTGVGHRLGTQPMEVVGPGDSPDGLAAHRPDRMWAAVASSPAIGWVLLGWALIVAALVASMELSMFVRKSHGEQPTVSPLRPGNIDNASTTPGDGQNVPVIYPNNDVCVTTECVAAAARYLLSIDPNVDPCVDPYAFTCGEWERSFKLPPDQASFTVSFTSVAQATQLKLKEILDSMTCAAAQSGLADGDVDTWKASMHCFNEACNDKEAIDQLDSEPLMELIEERLPWILHRDWTVEEAELPPEERPAVLGERVAQLHLLGVDVLFETGVELDVVSGTGVYVMSLGQGGLGMPYRNYHDNDSVKRYNRLLIRLFDLYGEAALKTRHIQNSDTENHQPSEQRKMVLLAMKGNHKEALEEEPTNRYGAESPMLTEESRSKPWERDNGGFQLTTSAMKATKVLEFEQALHGIMLSPVEMRDPTNTTISIRLERPKTWMSPVVDISHYMKTVKSSVSKATLSSDALNGAVSIDNNQLVLVDSVEYLPRLAEIIQNTSWETLMDYFLAHLVQASAPILGGRWLATVEDWHREVTDSQPPPRWRKCLGTTERLFGWVLARDFIANESHRKAQAVQILEQIKKSMEVDLRESPWMDQDTRKRALLKLSRMDQKLGYPDWLVTDPQEKFKRMYGSPVPDADHYFRTFYSMYDASVVDTIRRIGEPRDRSRWSMTPQIVNAYYSPALNEVVFPSSILQVPFYYPWYDSSPEAESLAMQALSYGAIGAVIGHEITHGFDDMGRKYDENGNLSNWWTEDSASRYEQLAGCLKDQYDHYAMGLNVRGSIRPIHVDGSLTLGENIADNGGLRLAFEALKRVLTPEQLARQPLPGLNLTAEQLFSLSFSHLWCQKATDAFRQQMMTVDVHSPNRFRVEGVLRNFAPYSDVYRCPAGCSVNPLPPTTRDKDNVEESVVQDDSNASTAQRYTVVRSLERLRGNANLHEMIAQDYKASPIQWSTDSTNTAVAEDDGRCRVW